MSLVTQKAPDFTAAAVLASGQIVTDFNLHKTLNGKYGLLFFYPLDFTFVCPSELIALHNRMEQFKARGIEVIGISIDSQFTHHAWRDTPRSKGGIGALDYTLVSDLQRSICQSYGIVHPQAGVALRAAFILDKNQIVKAQIVNDLPLGRNIDELLRTFDALQYHEEHGEVCPAGWNKGKQGMKATAAGVASYLTDNEQAL